LAGKDFKICGRTPFHPLLGLKNPLFQKMLFLSVWNLRGNLVFMIILSAMKIHTKELRTTSDLIPKTGRMINFIIEISRKFYR
jgi:ABC-type enterochelin transport system permease subunit